MEIRAGAVKINTNGDVEITGNLYVAGRIETKELKTNSIIIADNSEDGIDSSIGTSEISTNATAGKTIIPIGGLEITIRNPKITDDTLVYVTPTSSTNNKTLYVKAKEDGFFTVGFSDPIDTEVSFNWWVIEVK